MQTAAASMLSGKGLSLTFVAKVDFRPEGIKKAELRVCKTIYGRQGAYLRGIAKRKIRYRKSYDVHAAPGAPPHTHGDKKLKRAIGFAATDTGTVIGPAANWIGRKVGPLHEFGGTQRVLATPPGLRKQYKVGEIGPVSTRRYTSAGTGREKHVDPLGGKVAWVRITSSTQAAHATRLGGRMAKALARYREAKYPARPYMLPSLAEARDRLPEFWHNAIHS